jgi:hypothetical protein
MGLPEPAPHARALVKVQVNEQAPVGITVGRATTEITLVAEKAPIVLRIEAPAWSVPGSAIDSGVRIDRVCAEPQR